MISSYNEFPLILLRDCVYNHLRRNIPILREIELNDDYKILSSENKYSDEFHVNLYKPKFASFVVFNPAQYILKAKLNESNRLYYEVADQRQLELNGYSVMTSSEFDAYKEEGIRLIKEVNELLDEIGDSNFPKNWESYEKLCRGVDF